MSKRPMIAEVLPTLVGIGPLPSVKLDKPRVAAVEIAQTKPAVQSFDEIEIDKVSVRFSPSTPLANRLEGPSDEKTHGYRAEEIEQALSFDADIDDEYASGFDREVDPAEFGLNFEPSQMAPQSASPKHNHDHLVATLASELDAAVDKVPLGVRNFIENDLRARFIGVGAL